MKRAFEVGHGLSCDVDRLIASRLLIQANSGGGKTRTLRRLLEQTHGKVQHLVIDPEGEYHTLREKFDYVLASPKGGDTVAHPRTAKLLAERLLQLGVSAILDIYELNPDERQRFVKAFLQALVDAPRNLWHPALIVLDEAHVYAPEGKESDSTSAVKAMASRGRKRGFCLVPATQRLAKLSKDVAAECNNKLIGRCTLDVDIKRAAEELGFTTNEQKQSLRQLEPGQFFAYGPAFGIAAPQVVHVGGIKTSHPEPGQQAAPVPPPTEKVRKMLQQLADLPAEAEAREKSLADLKKENADLRRQVAQASKATKPEKAAEPSTKIVEKKVLGPKEVAKLKALLTNLAKTAQVIDDAESKVAALVKLADDGHLQAMETGRAIRQALDGFRLLLDPPAAPVPSRPIAPARAAAAAIQRPSPRSGGNGAASEPAEGITPVGQRVLNALAELEALGAKRPKRVLVALMAGYTHLQSTGFVKAMSGLSTRGFVAYPSAGEVELTDSGRGAASAVDAPRDAAEVQERVIRILGGKTAEILRPIIDAYPEAIEREAVANAANYTHLQSTGFVKAMSRLSSLGFVTYPSTRMVKASPVLFLECA